MVSTTRLHSDLFAFLHQHCSFRVSVQRVDDDQSASSSNSARPFQDDSPHPSTVESSVTWAMNAEPPLAVRSSEPRLVWPSQTS
jgi:hypothetical protein